MHVNSINDKPSKYIPNFLWSKGRHWLVFYLPQCLAPLRNIKNAYWIECSGSNGGFIVLFHTVCCSSLSPTTSRFQFDHSWLWDSSNMCSPEHFPNSPQWNAELLGKTHYPQKWRSSRFWPGTCQLGESPPAENFRGRRKRGKNRKDRLAASNNLLPESLAADIFSNICIMEGDYTSMDPILTLPWTSIKKTKMEMKKWNKKGQNHKKSEKKRKTAV